MKMRVDEVLHAAHCAPAMYKRTPEIYAAKSAGDGLKPTMQRKGCML